MDAVATLIEDAADPRLNSVAHAAEHCAVDARSLALLGSDVGRQLLVVLPPGQVALYTVVERVQARGRQVRVGSAGRARLRGPGPAQSPPVRVTLDTDFLGREIADGISLTEQVTGAEPSGVALLAPHAGFVERGTGEQAGLIRDRLAQAGTPARAWIVSGLNPAGAHRCWHITASEISARSFPKLAALLGTGPSVPFAQAIALHGHDDSETIVVGGGRPDDAAHTRRKHVLADRIRGALDAVLDDRPAVRVELSGPLAGVEASNVVNRLTAGGTGLQLEQPRSVRDPGKPRDAIVRAVAGFIADPGR